MRETVEFSLDGDLYTITQWSAMEGLRMQSRLAPFLKPLAKALAAADGQGQESEDMDTAAIFASDGVQDAIVDFIDAVSTSKAPELIRDLFKGVEVIDHRDGDPIKVNLERKFDQHFAGRLALVYRLLPKIMEVQYGDFFGPLKDLFGKTAQTGSPTAQSALTRTAPPQTGTGPTLATMTVPKAANQDV